MKKFGKRPLSMLLAGSLLLGEALVCQSAMPVYAAENEKGKYVSDVYIAYGKTEQEAKDYLEANGWEVLSGNCDFNIGKASGKGENVAAVMGFKRTDDADEAITDIAAVNMKSDYSFPQYQKLVEQKNTEIREFINDFLPAIREYRENYSEKQSGLAHTRAQAAHDLLNRFYDGGEEEPYRKNDTGKPLGDLFLEKLRQEEGGENGGDFRQIILESSGAAVMAIESILALAADTGDETWLDRLSGLTDEELEDNVGLYCPSAAGVDVAPSAVKQYYKQDYEDIAKKMAKQWGDVHDSLNWLKSFEDKYDIATKEGESKEQYKARFDQMAARLKAEDPEGCDGTLKKFDKCKILSTGLDSIAYKGKWGETLGDFFDPEGDASWAADSENYIPLGVALSAGQRSALDVIPLETMLMAGFATEDGVEDMLKDAGNMKGDENSVSVYSGINRGIFRDGVALTPTALNKTEEGTDPFGDIYDWGGATNITLMATAVVGAVTLAIGSCVCKRVSAFKRSVGYKQNITRLEARQTEIFANAEKDIWKMDNVEDIGKYTNEKIAEGNQISKEITENAGNLKKEGFKVTDINDNFSKKINGTYEFVGLALSCIGVAMLVGSIVYKVCEVSKAKSDYYNKDFTL